MICPSCRNWHMEFSGAAIAAAAARLQSSFCAAHFHQKRSIHFGCEQWRTKGRQVALVHFARDRS